jgi:hypothetical protein
VTDARPTEDRPDLVSRAIRLGPLRYSELGPTRAGPPAVGAGWLAVQLDRWWAQLGRPDPFVVVDVGASDGRRAAQALAEPMACRSAIRWVLVEPDPVLRQAQGTRVSLEVPALVLGPVGPAGPDPDDPPETDRGRGPLATSLEDLPAGMLTGVVIAVGWLSAQPVDLFEWHPDGWREVRLAAYDGALRELAVPASPGDIGRLEGLVTGDRPDGGRTVLQDAARRWLSGARATFEFGLVVVVDEVRPLTALRPAPAADGPPGPTPPGHRPPGPPGRWPLFLDQIMLDHRPSDGPDVVAGEMVAVAWAARRA